MSLEFQITEIDVGTLLAQKTSVDKGIIMSGSAINLVLIMRNWCLLLLFMPGLAVSTVYIDCNFNSPPSSENGGGIYTCSTGSMSLYFGSNLSGQVFDHDPAGGWDGSGAAKFYSHIAAQSYTNSYRQLNPGNSGSASRQNTRWVMKYQNPAELSGKWHEGTDGSWRTWLSFTDRGCGLVGSYMPEIAYNSTLWITHGGGYSSGCGYQWCATPSTWGTQISSCTIHETDGFWLSNYIGQWIAIEVERTSTGGYKIYTWTRDGAFNGAFYSIDTTFSDSLSAHNVGAYLEGNLTGQAFWIDDVVYADTYIGPPAGFVTGADTIPPSDVSGLSATAVSSSQINLSWNAATDNIGIAGYNIERCSGASCSNFAQVHQTTGTGTTWNNAGLLSSTLYRYRIKARDATGNVSVNYSAIAQATTQAPPDTTPPTVNIITPNPSTISVNSLTITGTASDAVGVVGCKWRVGVAPDANNGTNCFGTTNFSCATSGYTQGANTVYVGCYDTAGNYGNSLIVVNYTILLSPVTNLRILY